MQAEAQARAIPHTFVPSTPAELAACLADPMWRICSGQLYKILVKDDDDDDGMILPFKPNRAQRRFMGRIWHRNIILKARQLGFTTLICILFLDHCLFNADQRAGIVAQDKEAAEAFFRDKVLLAYNNLPESVRQVRGLTKKTTTELAFSNGSLIRVGVSLRSGTYHRLHISEFGKTSAKFPDKAKEIKLGTLPTCPLSGIAIIESTAEGQEGEFYDMTTKAMELADAGKILTPRDYRFHFFPWWQEPGYRLSDEHAANVPINGTEHEYFDGVQAVMGCKIDLGQRAWYIATRDSEFGGDPEDMWQEYPSTPREAFQVSTDGYYYAVQLAQTRKAGRVGMFPYMPGHPVQTWWDIGHSDGTAIWLHQHVHGLDRFFSFVEGWEKPYNHFTSELQRISADVGGITWGTHHLPHDAEHKIQLGERTTSPLEELEALKLGGKWEVVPRVDDLQHGIQLTRKDFATSAFDEVGCKAGLLHLAGYKKRWNRAAAAWSDEPVKNTHTEAADAYRQHAQGWHAPREVERESRRRQNRNWKTR